MPNFLGRLTADRRHVLRVMLGTAGIFFAVFGSSASLTHAQEITPFERSLIEVAPELWTLIKAEFPAEYSDILTAIQETRHGKGDLKIATATQLVGLRIKYAEAVFQAEDVVLREVIAHSRHILETVYANEGPETCGKMALTGPSVLSAEAIHRLSEELLTQAVKVMKAIASGRKNAVERNAVSEADWGSAFTYLMENEPESVVSAIIDADPSNPQLCTGMIALIDAVLRDGREMERVRADFVHELAIAPAPL